ncbi:ABC transporter permease [Agrobacterium sp. NPDC089420]|uniref:ABC transporter permease n=1 Tax=Agrobacterium sp. NPDC089420 TaxID=3363918 RepID=UPI00384B4C0C
MFTSMPWPIRLTILMLLALVVVALLTPFLTPYGIADQNLLARLSPPLRLGGVPEHPLGTDRLGRDIFTRLAFGFKVSVAVALLGTVTGAVFGCTVGFIAAHFRGWVEEALMMFVDMQASLPFILVALTMLAFFGNSLPLTIVLMALYGWENYARLTRGVVLSAVSQPYAEAVDTLGATPWRLYFRHILPNIMGVLIVQVTLTFPQIILLESALSFLGLGIQPPLTSLGQIMGDGRDYLSTAWWISVIPGAVIFIIALSVSLVGDWLRDRLDPTLKREFG